MAVMSWPRSVGRDHNAYPHLLATLLAEQPDIASVEEFSRARLLRRRYDVVHVHWPEFALNYRPWWRGVARSASCLALLWWARRRGAAVVWTAHNLAPHEPRLGRYGRWYLSAFQRLVDGAVYLSEDSRRRDPRRANRAGVVSPHPTYDTVTGRDPQAARARLDLPDGAPVLAFVGRLRRYKGVADLARAFAGADLDAWLVVAGAAEDPGETGALSTLAAASPRIRLRLGHQSDEDLADVLAAADLVVLPYRSVTNSGAALLALTAHRPVLVPALAVFDELGALVGDEWVQRFQPPLDAADLETALARLPAPGAAPRLDALRPETHALATLSLYEQARAARRGH